MKEARERRAFPAFALDYVVDAPITSTASRSRPATVSSISLSKAWCARASASIGSGSALNCEEDAMGRDRKNHSPFHEQVKKL
jgi:hypothetical protein